MIEDKYMDNVYEHMIKVNKGWSKDDKFLVTYQSQIYFLRISRLNEQLRIEKIFDFMNKVSDLSILICKPIRYMIIEHHVHGLYQYIYGSDLIDILQSYTKEEQYLLGIKSGEYLKKIHAITTYEHSDVWATKFNRKIDDKMKKYRDSHLQVPEMELFINYINKHRELLLNRPQCIQHGDYHVGNFMVDQFKNLIIVDFEKLDIGDPWEEFNRIVWSAQQSHEFASGMLDGYFQNEIPEHFWKLLLLYISNNTISSLPWALSFSKEEYQIVLNQMHDILDWYDNLNSVVPKWYIKNYITKNKTI